MARCEKDAMEQGLGLLRGMVLRPQSCFSRSAPEQMGNSQSERI
jgi:hypothetical protein